MEWPCAHFTVLPLKVGALDQKHQPLPDGNLYVNEDPQVTHAHTEIHAACRQLHCANIQPGVVLHGEYQFRSVIQAVFQASFSGHLPLRVP